MPYQINILRILNRLTKKQHLSNVEHTQDVIGSGEMISHNQGLFVHSIK